MLRLGFVCLAAALLGCGGKGDGSSNGTGGSGANGGGPSGSTGTQAGGGGGAPPVCKNADNPPGPVVDLAWPAASNVGHDAVQGDTVHFHWTGSHNVLQVATFDGQVPPTPVLGDAKWPGELRSGPKRNGGVFDWNVGAAPCGYRPGIYFFVDEDDPAGGIVSVSLTATDPMPFADRPCADLADPGLYGGRYASFAGRHGCTVHEVNDFQTEAHFDWVPPVFVAKQGDPIVFRWSGEHNVVQVHDVTKDALVPGGVSSGKKTLCVPGPHFECVDGAGEFIFDTKDFHPGTIHFSDECAMTCTGHTTGMNVEFDLRYPVTPRPPVAGTCCAIDKSKGQACRVVEITNANDGAQFDYNIPVGQGDLVRFTWAGSLRIFQSVPNGDGSPSSMPKPGGLAMPSAVECVPGPHLTCLGGNTAQAEFVVDVAKAIAAGKNETNGQGQAYFDFHATGENTPGFTSADTGTIVYVDGSIPFDPNPTPCP